MPLIVDGAYGYQTAEEIKENIGEHLVEVSRALFDRAAYTGAVATDPDDGTEYFADPEEFTRLQEAAIEARRAALAEKWAWVEVERGYGFSPWRYGKSADRTRAGAVLVVTPDGKVEVHGGLVKPKDAKKAAAAKGKKGKGAAEAAPPREPFTKTLLAYARNRKTEALQAAVLRQAQDEGNADAAVLAAILGLAGAHRCVALGGRDRGGQDRVLAPPVAEILDRYRKRLGKPFASTADGRDVPFFIDGGWHRGGEFAAFANLAGLTPAERLELFAALVAAQVGSFNGADPEPGDEDVARVLAARLRIDMAAAWRPDADYLERCRKPRLLALVRGLKLPLDKPEKMTGKALGAAILAALPDGPLAWVPPELRFATADEVAAAVAEEEGA